MSKSRQARGTMLSSKRGLISLVLLLGLLALSGADEPAAEEPAEDSAESADGDDGPLGPSEFAQTVTLFPDYPDKRIILGELVEVLCGFTNVGDKSFNVTQLKGSLNSATNYQFIQNFTEISPFVEVKKGEQATVSYRFFPDPQLDPKEYTLTLSIDYIDADKEEYRTYYFNSTIEVVESQSSLDSRTFFGRVLALCILSLVGFFGYRQFKKSSAKKARRDPATKQGEGNEWLQDVSKATERKPASVKKGSKSKSS